MEVNYQAKLNEHNELIQKKTCTIKEFAGMIGVSESKARELSRVDGFPLLRLGKKHLVLLNQVDTFLESLIGKRVG